MDLAEIRKEIDRINGELLRLFLERMDLSDQIAVYKSVHRLPILDRVREDAILDAMAAEAGRLEPYVRRFFSVLMELSRSRQAERIRRGQAGGKPEPLSRSAANIVLIGMPGCGKSTTGAALSRLTGREVVDIDRLIVRQAGKGIPEIFTEDGEAAFRELERSATADAGKRRGVILATGGGVVKDARNYAPLKQNGRIYHLIRDPSLLSRDGRPLSQGADLALMEAERRPLYRAFRDVVIDNNGTIEETSAEIWREFCAFFPSG